MLQATPSWARMFLVAVVIFATLVLATGSPGAVTPKQQAALDAQATKLIRNGRYVGTRGDGSSVDMTFCTNGKYRSQVDDGISDGSKWLVRRSTFTKTGFTAIIAKYKDRRKGGFAIAIARRGTAWYIGIESFDKATMLGRVVRTPVSGACPQAS